MSRSKRKSQDPDDTTVMIFGAMVRDMKALPNWDKFRFVPAFVRDAVRYYLQRQEERAGMVFSVDRQEDGSDREESP